MTEKFANLPGPVRIMLPEIETIAHTVQDVVLLTELAKSASTRSLIGSQITSSTNAFEVVEELLKKTKDISVRKRLQKALERTAKALKKLDDI